MLQFDFLELFAVALKSCKLQIDPIINGGIIFLNPSITEYIWSTCKSLEGLRSKIEIDFLV